MSADTIQPGRPPYVLGIDLGTSSCKVCAVDASGRHLGARSAGFPTLTPRAGWAEQDPQHWVPAATEATRQLLSEGPVPPEEVGGLSLSSAAHIAVLLDAGGSPLRNSILWYDQRSLNEVEELKSQRGHEIFRLSHNSVSPTWTLPQLLWVRRQEPEVWSKVRRIALSKDYLSSWLTGRWTTDPATALSSMLFDAHVGDWSVPLLDPLGLAAEALPRVHPSTARVGSLTAAAAQELGVPAGVPVINGTLDSAAETYGAGVVRPGDCLLRLATAGGIHLVLEAPHPHPGLITYPHPVSPLWYSQAGTNSCTSALHWVFRTVGSGRPGTFQEWDPGVEAVPQGAEGLFFHPYLSGERCPYWDGRLRASFTGATFSHHPEHFVRAAYEGTAFSLRDALGVLDDLGDQRGTITVVGGGTAGKLWTRIVCDVLGKTLQVARVTDSAYGAALLGLVGIGLYSDVSQPLAGSRQELEVVSPDPERARGYTVLFDRYREIQQKLQPVYHAMNG